MTEEEDAKSEAFPIVMSFPPAEMVIFGGAPPFTGITDKPVLVSGIVVDAGPKEVLRVKPVVISIGPWPTESILEEMVLWEEEDVFSILPVELGGMILEDTVLWREEEVLLTTVLPVELGMNVLVMTVLGDQDMATFP